MGYREKHGNCNVPPRQTALGNWVGKQRCLHKKGWLSQERTTELHSIGFSWNTDREKDDDERWQERFNDLVLYKEENGDCGVPFNEGALGLWVAKQRKLHKNGKLSHDRTTQLESIEFSWVIRKKYEDKLWKDRFDELIVYKEKNGNY